MTHFNKENTAVRNIITTLAIALAAVAYAPNAFAQELKVTASATTEDPEAGVTVDSSVPAETPAPVVEVTPSHDEVMGICAPLFREGKASADLAIWAYADDNRRYFAVDAKAAITNIVGRLVPKAKQKAAIEQLQAFWITGAEASENIGPEKLMDRWQSYNAYLGRNKCTSNGQQSCKNLRDEVKKCAAAVLSRAPKSPYKARAERMFSQVIDLFEDQEQLQILFYHAAVFLNHEEYWEVFVAGDNYHGMKALDSSSFAMNAGRDVDVIRFGKEHIHGYQISPESSATQLSLVNPDGYAPPLTLKGQDLAEAKVFVMPGSSKSSKYFDALAGLAAGKGYQDFAARLAPTADPNDFLNYRAAAFWKDGREGWGKIGKVTETAFYVGDTRVPLKDLRDEEVVVMLGEPPAPTAVARLGSFALSIDHTLGFGLGSNVPDTKLNATVISFAVRAPVSAHLALKARVGLGLIHADGMASYATKEPSFGDRLDFLGKVGVGSDVVFNKWFGLGINTDFLFSTGGIGVGGEVLAVFSVSDLVSLYGGLALGYIETNVEPGSSPHVFVSDKAGDIKSGYIGPMLGARLDL